MNDKTLHLIWMVCALGALVLLTVTGHDGNAIVMSLLTGLVGGSGGNLGSALVNTATASRAAKRAGGFIRVSLALALFVVAALGTVIMSGCSSLTSQTPTQKIEYACATASASVKALTVVEQSGALSAGEEETISRSIEIMRPVCTAPNPPQYSDVAYAALTESIAELQKLQNKYHANP